MIKPRVYTFFVLWLLLLYACSFKNGLTPADDQNPSINPPGENGPCAYSTTDGPASLVAYMSDVQSLTFRIPTTNAHPPFPTIIIEPGFFSLATDLEDVQNQYASHGFLVIGVNNTAHFNLITTNLEPYKAALLQTVRFAIESSRDSANTLFGKVDTTALGISGHSMGGGGAIMACNATADPYNRYIKSAIAMNPYGKCSCANITAPICLIASQNDSITNPFMWGLSAKPENVYFSYQSAPSTTIKLFTIFKDMDHNGVVDANLFLSTSGNAQLFLPTMVAWFKVYLARDNRYQIYLDTTGTGYAALKSRFIGTGDVPAYLYGK
jgi:dienelactone hydrolase